MPICFTINLVYLSQYYSIGFPGLSNFVGEMLYFIAIFGRNSFVAFLAVGGYLV